MSDGVSGGGAVQASGQATGSAAAGSVEPGAEPKPNAPGAPPAKPAEPVDPWVDAFKTKPLKVKRRDGREVVIDTADKMLHYASKGFGAESALIEKDDALREAAEHKDILKRLKENPRATLRELLGDEWSRTAAEEALEQYDEAKRLEGVPENVRAELAEGKKLRAEAAKRQAEDEKRQMSERQRQQMAEQNAAANELLTDGVTALKAAGYPAKPPPTTLLRMAPYLAQAHEMGFKAGDAAHYAAQAFREDQKTEFAAVTGGYTKQAADAASKGDHAGVLAAAKSVVEWLGEDVVNLLRKYDLARLRGPVGGNTTPPPPAPPGQQQQQQESTEDKSFWRATNTRRG